jgi:catechol-2,3-dioxygenase
LGAISDKHADSIAVADKLIVSNINLDNGHFSIQEIANLTMASFAVKSIDHVVLTVKSIEATVDFYTKRLGMKHEVFTSKGVERYAVSSPFISED